MLCFCWPLLLLGLNSASTAAAAPLRVAGTLVAHGTDLAKFVPCTTVGKNTAAGAKHSQDTWSAPTAHEGKASVLFLTLALRH